MMLREWQLYPHAELYDQISHTRHILNEHGGADIHIHGRTCTLRIGLESPAVCREECAAVRVHQVFVSLGLRHLCVVDSGNHVLGIITRKDLDRAAGSGSWRRNPKFALPPFRAPMMPMHGPWASSTSLTSLQTMQHYMQQYIY